MLVGYVWTLRGDPESLYEQQHRALLEADVANNQIYSDSCQRREERPHLQRCLEVLKSGDTLILWRLDRLADSRTHLLQTLRFLEQQNVQLKTLSGQGAELSTANINLSTIIAVIAALTEMEEQIVRQASAAGMEAARARGQAFGPKRKMTADMLRQAMDLITNSDISFADIAKQFGFTRAGLYNYLNGDGSPKPSGLKLLEEDSSSESDAPVDGGNNSSTNS